MSEEALYCAECQVKFRTKAFDPNKAYKCPKCGGALVVPGSAQPEAEDAVPEEPKAPAARPRWLKTAVWIIALTGAVVVGWLSGPRPRVNVLPEPKPLTPRARPRKGKVAPADASSQVGEAKSAAKAAPDVTATRDTAASGSSKGAATAPPVSPQPPVSGSPRSAAGTVETPPASMDSVAQAALDALDGRIGELVLLRQYEGALQRCDEALRGLQKDEPSAPFVAQHVALWRAQIDACRSLVGDAHRQAPGLVGKTVDVEVRVGKKGGRRISGEVAAFEDGALLLKAGAKDTRVPVADLGPYHMVRIASGKDLLEARRRVVHARFLLTEGHAQEAGEELKCAEEQGRQVPEIVEACAEAREFLGLWTGRQQRLANERLAKTVISDLTEAYRDGEWGDIAHLATRLDDELGETQVYRDGRTLIEVLRQGAAKHLVIDEVRSKELRVWKRLGPTVAVPVERGKPRPMPVGIIADAVLSPDGKQLAVAHAFGVDLWRTKTQAIVRRLDGHKLAVTSLACAPKGKQLATGSMDATVCLWDVRRGEVVHTFKGHTGDVTGVCFSPRGRWLASGASDGTVRVWDVGKGKSIGVLKGHQRTVSAVSFTPKGRRLLSVDGEHAVRLWDPAKEKLLWTAKCGPLAQAVLSPDGGTVALACKDGKVRLLSATKGTETQCLTGHGKSVRSVCFDRTGQWLASSGGDSTVRLWRLPKGELVSFFKHILAPRSVSFSPDGRWLLSTCLGGSQLWDVESGKGRRLKTRSGASSVSKTMFSSDGRWAAALSPVSDVALYALPGGELLDRVGGYAPGLRSVAVSPDGSSVATGTVEGVKLWAVATADTASKPIRRWSLLAEPCALTSFGPDGRQLAASQRSAVWVGDVGRKTKGRALSAGKKHAITALAWRQNGSQIATGGRDALVRVWDSATAKQLRALKKHKKAIVCMASSPDGRHLVSAGGDKTLCVWDWTAGKPLKQHKIAADALCYDPTGRWLACASGGKVSLVNALSGKEVRGLADLGAPISCLAISSDGRRIACGDRGGKVSVLDVETGKAVQEIREHRMPVTHVSFSRGEPMILASRSRDGAVCIMKAGLEDQGQGRRGAGEIAWLTDLFGAAESRPAAVVDLDPSQVKTDGSSRVWEQRSSDADGPPDCLGGSQLRWSAKEPGDRIRFCVNLAQAGKYLVGARITRLADGGTFEVMASDQKVGVSCDTVLSKVRGRVLHATETVRIGPCTLTRGENELKLTVAGSPRASTGYAFSIDAIVLWQEH